MWNSSTTSVVLIFCMCMVSETLCMEQEVKPSCAETDEECEFFWTIDYKLTMNVYKENPKVIVPVILKNGSLYINNCDSVIPMTKDVLDSVITADGRYKLLYTINREFPGPNIVVYENQTIVVHVKNNLINEVVTIHWHGIPQDGTPWMDGVSMLSQYPIHKGETFTYRFRASDPGTYWYHSHHGSLRTKGLAGALIILPREDSRPKIKQNPENDFIFTLTDWYADQPALEIYSLENDSGGRYQGKFDNICVKDKLYGSDGVPIKSKLFESGLINGKGWIFDENYDPIAPEIPLEKFHVTPDKIYKFRLINIGNIQAFRFSIDQHELTVVAADGFDVEPIDLESLIIYPGERFDVLIHTDQISQTYWIRAELLTTRQTNGSFVEPYRTLGILHYIEGADVLPSSKRRDCLKEHPCVVLACPYSQKVVDILGLNQNCVSINELIPTEDSLMRKPVPIPEPGEDIFEAFLNFNFQVFNDVDIRGTHAVINGKKFLDPPFPFQLSAGQHNEKDIELATHCNETACETRCACTHMLKLKKDQIVQFILTSQEAAPIFPVHPIHLHGPNFHVLKLGFPEYDDMGILSKPSPDVVPSEYYTTVSWANKDWYGDIIPGLNLKNPPIKDTVAFPAKGYAVIRFRATNPGFWQLHCHIQPHNVLGMTMILQVGETSEMPPLPRDSPGRLSLNPKPSVSGDDQTDEVNWFQIAVIICCALLLLIIVIQFWCLTKQYHNNCEYVTYKYVTNGKRVENETTRLIESNHRR